VIEISLLHEGQFGVRKLFQKARVPKKMLKEEKKKKK
jgi:hypothetical protein